MLALVTQILHRPHWRKISLCLYILEFYRVIHRSIADQDVCPDGYANTIITKDAILEIYPDIHADRAIQRRILVHSLGVLL